MLLQQGLRNLKKVSIEISHQPKQELNLQILNQVLPSLHNLKLSIHPVVDKFYVPINIVKDLQTFNHLKNLSLEMFGSHIITEELLLILAQSISSMNELESVKLSFFHNIRVKPLLLNWENYSCFEALFRAMSQKNKLQKLWLVFALFKFENCDFPWKSLSQSLENLSKLEDFRLKIPNIRAIKNEDFRRFAQSLSKLAKMQSLQLDITYPKGMLFEEPNKSFVYLIESISNNLCGVSKLCLSFRMLQITDECGQVIYKAIQKLRSLNSIKFILEGNIEMKHDNAHLIQREIQKRMSGFVWFIPSNS